MYVNIWSVVGEYISVDDYSGWEEGMTIALETAGADQEKTVVDVFADEGYIQLDTTIDNFTYPDRRVARKIGNDVGAFAAFGTPFPTSDPVVGDPTWGFRATIDHNHAEIRLGMRLRAEIIMTDPPLNLKRKVVATVTNE
jgi:hypothetical protein